MSFPVRGGRLKGIRLRKPRSPWRLHCTVRAYSLDALAKKAYAEGFRFRKSRARVPKNTLGGRPLAIVGQVGNLNGHES
jgi:hypothetical protein